MSRFDQWLVPKKIYDAHLHIFTYKGMEKRVKQAGMNSVEEMAELFSKRTNNKFEIPPKDTNELLKRWVGEMNANNVEKALILPDWNSTEIVELASKDYPDRFIPYLMINPMEEGAYELMVDAFSKWNIRGIKLYPPLHYYHAYDKRLTPFYEFCADNQLLITYHMGISIGQSADLRFMNPSDVSPIARDYQKIKFLFAHFATGYLRELLFLMYHLDNVYAESSSSNKWMEYLPYKITLKEVFEKIISLKGTGKIIFGTDSTMFPRGWRTAIYQRQLNVCNELELSQEDIDKIFYKNLKTLLV